MELVNLYYEIYDHLACSTELLKVCITIYTYIKMSSGEAHNTITGDMRQDPLELKNEFSLQINSLN